MLQTYIDVIQTASPNETDTLTQTLMTGLNLVNVEISCAFNKIRIIWRAFMECSNGYDTFTKIWSDIIQRELQKFSHCHSAGMLTEMALKGAINHQLESENKSTVCLRNSKDKFQLACSNYYANVDTVTSSVTVSVTIDDINYFVSRCPKTPFSNIEEQNVCTRKSNGESVAVLQNYFSKHDNAELPAIYNACSFTVGQINDICTMKTQGKNVSVVQEKYNLYPASMIQTNFDSCQKPELNEFYKNLVCDLKKQGIGLDHKLFVDLKHTFDATAIDDYYNNIC